MSVDVSLDNVTWVGEWDDWGAVVEWLEAERLHDRLCEPAVLDRVVPRAGSSLHSSTMRHQQAYTVDGAYASCWVELSTLGRAWVLADLDGRCRGRLELNPNKLTERSLALLRRFRVDHPTRADVALDYPGVRVGDYWWHRPRVKAHEWRGSEGVESLYLGSVASERYLRVYNKAEELGVGGDLTRCEAVGRGRHVLSKSLFDGLVVRAKEIPSGLSLSDVRRLCVVLHEPDALQRMSAPTRRAYRRAAERIQLPLSPSPQEVYDDRRGELVGMLDSLSEGEPVRVAAVYADQVNAPPGVQPEGAALGGLDNRTPV